ncbi:hypothetical protein NXW78_28305 [Bacteroides ovatus]|nr:hypothetical protein [Bacteroides ovatus]
MKRNCVIKSDDEDCDRYVSSMFALQRKAGLVRFSWCYWLGMKTLKHWKRVITLDFV